MLWLQQLLELRRALLTGQYLVVGYRGGRCRICGRRCRLLFVVQHSLQRGFVLWIARLLVPVTANDDAMSLLLLCTEV